MPRTRFSGPKATHQGNMGVRVARVMRGPVRQEIRAVAARQARDVQTEDVSMALVTFADDPIEGAITGGTGETRTMLDPATGGVVGEAPVHSVEDLDRAVAAAAYAQPGWAALGHEGRSVVVSANTDGADLGQPLDDAVEALGGRTFDVVTQVSVGHAWLNLPDGASEATPAPVLVMGHGLGAIKEMRLDAFAERFQAAGYACLVFDYRHFGQSEGEPRELLSIARQQEDWRSAVAFVRTLPEIDADAVDDE